MSGNVWGQVRAIFNEKGTLVGEATPSTPVLAAGWNKLPQVEDECFEVRGRRCEGEGEGVSLGS